MKPVGILALQGDYSKHAETVRRLGRTVVFVKTAKQLHECESLIIPGGESTTFLKLIERLGFLEDLKNFCSQKPVFGTCAGLIILAKNVSNLKQSPLGLIDISVERNAYGRQVDSFVDNINFEDPFFKTSFEAVFIRAPKIKTLNGNTRIIARHGKDIVMAANKNILVATFHPELTDDDRIHEYFLSEFSSTV